MLQVGGDPGAFSVKILYRLERTVFSCEQQTPLFYKGHLFGILPKDAEGLRNQLACLNPDGKLAWTSGKADRFGLGPFLIADDKIFVLNDDGVLTLARAATDAYVRLAQAKVMDGRDAWGPMALVGGKLILRDVKRMLCLDVAKK
jgi:outer membrane protein assembly factor BamB